VGNLINEALSIGWVVLALLVGLLIYFQVSIKDPVAKKRATFKTLIGIMAAFLLFIAIANYKNNFYGENRLLPVSLVMITVTTFVMALYFTNLAALLKIGGFMFFVAAFLSGYGNWLPQVEGGFPPKEEKLDFNSMSPQQLADEGEKIIFGGIGQNKVQGAIGKGQCPLCHAFHAGMLVNGLPTYSVFPSGQARNGSTIRSIRRGTRRSASTPIRNPVPAVEPLKLVRNISPNPIRAPVAMWCPGTA
jgi:hypothetical protein